MFENPRRGRQARHFTTSVPKILDLKSSSEQIFLRKLTLGDPERSSKRRGVGDFAMNFSNSPQSNKNASYTKGHEYSSLSIWRCLFTFYARQF